jgi:hypothetical protein
MEDVMTWRHVRKMAVPLLGLVAALALATSARAGGWAVVVLDTASAGTLGDVVPPGVPVTVGFTVLQHGRTPMTDLTPQLILTRDGGGVPITISATPEGEPGHYRATVTLPEAGLWQWRIEAFGMPNVMAPITVANAPARGLRAMPLVLLVIGLLACIGLLGLRRRSGRGPAPATQ